MFVRFRCPKCRAGLKAPETRRGHVIDCPGCGQLLRIPGPKTVGVEAAETTDYIAFDDQTGSDTDREQASVANEPSLPRPKRKIKRKRAAEPGLSSYLGGSAATAVICVLVSLLLVAIPCSGMLVWVYLNGKYSDEIPIVSLSAAQLAQEYRDNPKVASARYEEGEVELEVVGVVRQVVADDAEGPHVVLTGAADDNPPWIRGNIDPEDANARARLRTLKVGDTVKFRGFCDGREGDFLNLSEIVFLP